VDADWKDSNDNQLACEGSAVTQSYQCVCEPVDSDLQFGDSGLEQRESCDGAIDTCFGDADEGCPQHLGNDAFFSPRFPIYAPTGVRERPRGEYNETIGWAGGNYGLDTKTRMLQSLKILTPDIEDNSGVAMERIGSVEVSYIDFPIDLMEAENEALSGENYDYYPLSLNVSSTELVGPDNVRLVETGASISCNSVGSGSGDGVSWSELEGTGAYSDVSGGWTPFIVGFLIERKPIYPDGECDQEHQNTCGLGRSPADGDCAGGDGNKWAGHGDGDCGYGLFCTESGEDICELIVRRDEDGAELRRTLRTGVEVDLDCVAEDERTVGLYWSPSEDRSECDDSPDLKNATRTSLMYDGITGIRPLCASMRVVEFDADAVDPLDRYRVEVAGSPETPARPRVGSSSFGTLAGNGVFPDLFDLPEGVELFADHRGGEFELAPISTIGFEYDQRPYPHESFGSGDQAASEAEAVDHIFWNMGAYWWRLRDEPRPSR
jgi:hypothetical protein